MTTEPVRAGADWLALREPADAAARATELVEELRPRLAQRPRHGRSTTSAAAPARWPAGSPRGCPGPSTGCCTTGTPTCSRSPPRTPRATASDGAPVTVETRQRDITRLDPEELAGASLVTASALLDMMTARRAASASSPPVCGAGCPVLITLTVTGRVRAHAGRSLGPAVRDAFNAHQRRDLAGEGRRLGPDALDAAVDAFTAAGSRGRRCDRARGGSAPTQGALTAEWFTGWVAAAVRAAARAGATCARSYVRRRLAELADGRLSVTVHHEDLLARPT